MKHPDCIIIGAGLIGLLSALELKSAGMHVMLLERGEAGREASWAGGGILSPLYPWRENDALQELSDFCQTQYPDLAESLQTDTGIDPEWQQSGLIFFGVEDQQQANEWASTRHCQMEELNSKQLQGMEPAVNVQAKCSIRLPGIAQIRNTRLLSALKSKINKLDVDLIEHTPVEQIVYKKNKATAVQTEGGNYSAGAIIVCNGAWGMDLLPGVDIRPVRGQMLCYRAPHKFFSHILLKDKTYVIPRKDGHVLVGSTLEETGFDKGITEDARLRLTAIATELLPEIKKLPLIAHWSGLRPATQSGIPYICRHPEFKGLYMNIGHFRNGILFAPGAARLIADLVLARPPTINADIFQYGHA